MNTSDEKILRIFAAALEIFPEISDPPENSVLKAAQIAIAKCYFCYDWSHSLHMNEMREHMEEHDDRIPLFLLLSLIGGHSKMSLDYAAYELLKDGRLRGSIEHLPSELSDWKNDGITIKGRFELPWKYVALPLVKADPSLKFLIVAHDRPCGARDHLWLQWNMEEGIGPAKIRDKWNGLSDDERRKLAPSSFKKVAMTSKEHGRETVAQAVKLARKELKEAGIRIAAAERVEPPSPPEH